MKIVHLLILGWICALPLAASAQWQWVDNQGKKVFSDQAPPPDIPEKNILRRAGGAPPRVSFSPAAPTAANPAVDGTAAAVAAPSPAASAAAKPSGVDKELAEKAKKAEEAEKAEKAAEAAKLAKAKTDNCARAKQGKATFDSGIRVARLNAQGEREIMDDKARAAEQKRLQTVIDSDCK
ncbi:MAG: DUF4124 domain-containing protein [Variovorax sp.]|nr:MAG: DUF4124 domain-containing protein [Variovorax sp.]